MTLKTILQASLLSAVCISPLLPTSNVYAHARNVHVVIRDTGFAPNQLLCIEHQPIHLTVENKGKQMHEFAIPEYRVYTRNLRPGETSEVEFSPWEKGSFVMYSDPEADSHPEFAGRFIVINQTNDE